MKINKTQMAHRKQRITQKKNLCSSVLSVRTFSLLYIVFLVSCSSKAKEPKVSPQTSAPVYNTVAIQQGGLNDTLRLPAQLVAWQEVTIFPKVNGYVKKVYVDMGTRVRQGQPLMLLEAPELQEASVQARENYTRAQANVSIDNEKANRLQEAAQTAGAVSPIDLSDIKTKTRADNAQAQAAKANWQMQQSILGYLSVTAPFGGVITERNVHPGALVSSTEKNKPMLVLKQIDRLRLQVDVPSGVAGNLKNNDSVSFYITALPGKKFRGVISRKSMNTNQQYGNEPIEIDVNNHDNLFTPGMYANVELYTRGNAGAFIVPKSAVLITTERKYVMIKNGAQLEKKDVLTGTENAGQIEVFGYLHVGDLVVTNPKDSE